MTFDEFLNRSASEDFLLKDGSVDSKEYVFENSKGDRIHVKQISTAVNDRLPAWAVEFNDERVYFDAPSQLITMATIVTGLYVRSLNAISDKLKQAKKEIEAETKAE